MILIFLRYEGQVGIEHYLFLAVNIIEGGNLWGRTQFEDFTVIAQISNATIAELWQQ